MYPNDFKDDECMLGPLHIEQNFMKAIGNWLEGSGWTKIYEYSTTTIDGKADGLLTRWRKTISICTPGYPGSSHLEYGCIQKSVRIN